MARGTTGKNRRQKARGKRNPETLRREARERRAREKALQADLSQLLGYAHGAVEALTGAGLFQLNEEEISNLSATLTKVIVARKKLANAEAQIAKRGPWTNFSLALITIYGPRLVMLWKMWEAERARQKRAVLTIVREESAAEAAPGVDPSKAVN